MMTKLARLLRSRAGLVLALLGDLLLRAGPHEATFGLDAADLQAKSEFQGTIAINIDSGNDEVSIFQFRSTRVGELRACANYQYRYRQNHLPLFRHDTLLNCEPRNHSFHFNLRECGEE